MDENIKQKIRKLLALAKSPNENEAVNALEKARKLMEENNLTEDDCTIHVSEVKRLKSSPSWQSLIAYSVAWINGCALINLRTAGKALTRFYGSETDTFIAAEMYNYLIKTINRMTKQNIRKNAKKPFIESYKLGVAYTLDQRMEKAGSLYSWSNKRDEQLERLQEYVDHLYENYETARVPKKGNQIAKNAFTRGMSAGTSISLNRQATGRTSTSIGGIK